MGLLLVLYNHLVQSRNKRKWRSINRHNNTFNGYINCDFNCIEIGKKTYGCINAIISRPLSRLIIGNYCSIANDVCFIVCSDHPLQLLSTFPFKTISLKENNTDAISKGDIVVEDDVWIGYGATILSGVHIGQGAVVAAGAVVSKDVPPYAVVGGVPAKVIKFRFNKEMIEFLLTLDYASLTKEMIRTHIDDFYRPIEDLGVEEVKKLYEWFPKKKSKKIVK